MKKLSYINFILIALFLAMLLINLFLLNKNSKLQKNLHTVSIEIQKIQNKESKLNLSQILKYQGSKCNKKLVLHNRKRNKITLQGLLEDKSNLFLIIPKYSCNSCYQALFDKLSKIESFFNYKIHIICSYKTIRNLIIFKKQYNIQSKVYNLKSKDLIKAESLHNKSSPIFIDISKEGYVLSTFFPDNNQISKVFNYLKVLKTKRKNYNK
jgi:hypothetical protein